jgi:hypothetical protein
MPYARRKFNPPKTIKKPRTMRTTRPKSNNRTFTKKVKTVLNQELETKKVSHLLGGVTDTVPLNIQASGLTDASHGAHIGNIWNTNNITIAQGTAQNQHVGRTVSNCKLYLKCCIQATFYNISTNTNQFPFDVYCIVYKDKQAPNTNSPDQLKINDQGSAHNISGTPSNFMLPFNKSRYIIYSNRKIATFKPMPVDRAAIADSSLQNPTLGSSDNKAFKYFGMKLPCPKTLEFKAGSSNLVTNAHLGIGFYVINGSGAALGSSQIRATVFPTS